MKFDPRERGTKKRKHSRARPFSLVFFGLEPSTLTTLTLNLTTLTLNLTLTLTPAYRCKVVVNPRAKLQSAG